MESIFERLRKVLPQPRVGNAVYFTGTGEWVWSPETYGLFRLADRSAPPSMKVLLARIHPADLLSCRDALRDWHAGKPVEGKIEFRVVDRDGTRHWRRIEPGSCRESEAEKCLLYAIEDISREKALEEEMLKAMEHERELARIKMEFLHMITHEYRTPLGVIQSSADILIRYHDRLGERERLERLEDIKRSTRILADLLEDVLMIGKSDSGKAVIHVKAVNLCQLIREVADTVVDNFGFPRNIEIRSPDPDPTLASDEQLLRHVFSNAISNALKYSTLDKSVYITIEPRREEVAVHIRDEGIGIPREELSRLFTMFYRASNVGSIAGTGLGLVVLKRCVDRLNGKIEVESAKGEGTTFTFLLPNGGVPATAGKEEA